MNTMTDNGSNTAKPQKIKHTKDIQGNCTMGVTNMKATATNNGSDTPMLSFGGFLGS